MYSGDNIRKIFFPMFILFSANFFILKYFLRPLRVASKGQRPRGKFCLVTNGIFRVSRQVNPQPRQQRPHCHQKFQLEIPLRYLYRENDTNITSQSVI